ncbi:MAG: hypothetical protein AW09_002601 [Candidatus Accumulibacter phosphatis]|uniref:Uncharacterized protein n=1 Tax=Candidatus Accumulibacter phosphatis TaxID=327160 RepID=A0A080LUL9_9PROT|nr:MAG: hypothetical protein AW09_002601 [Candidatus Accumulibacter phosphatis]
MLDGLKRDNDVETAVGKWQGNSTGLQKSQISPISISLSGVLHSLGRQVYANDARRPQCHQIRAIAFTASDIENHLVLHILAGSRIAMIVFQRDFTVFRRDEAFTGKFHLPSPFPAACTEYSSSLPGNPETAHADTSRTISSIGMPIRPVATLELME